MFIAYFGTYLADDPDWEINYIGKISDKSWKIIVPPLIMPTGCVYLSYKGVKDPEKALIELTEDLLEFSSKI